jgi:hypothetical protein
LYESNAYNQQVVALRMNQSFAFKFLWKTFCQNSLIPIQIFNGFFIIYCATWDRQKYLETLEEIP